MGRTILNLKKTEHGDARTADPYTGASRCPSSFSREKVNPYYNFVPILYHFVPPLFLIYSNSNLGEAEMMQPSIFDFDVQAHTIILHLFYPYARILYYLRLEKFKQQSEKGWRDQVRKEVSMANGRMEVMPSF